MLIQVLFANKSIGVISQNDLDRQIANGSVAAFRRLDGWVVIGRDPVRNGNLPYQGEERRGRISDIPTYGQRATGCHPPDIQIKID